MELNIKNKRVLVTGSSKGIGFGILNSLGSVVIANTEIMKAQKITNELKCQLISADVSNPEQAADLIEKSIGLMGGLDILICMLELVYQFLLARIQRTERIFNMNFSTTTLLRLQDLILIFSGTIVCISSVCEQILLMEHHLQCC